MQIVYAVHQMSNINEAAHRILPAVKQVSLIEQQDSIPEEAPSLAKPVLVTCVAQKGRNGRSENGDARGMTTQVIVAEARRFLSSAGGGDRASVADSYGDRAAAGQINEALRAAFRGKRADPAYAGMVAPPDGGED